MMFSKQSFPTVLFTATVSLFSVADEGIDEHAITIIEPKSVTTLERPAAIDSEHFELGLIIGMQSVEDFSPSPLYGISLSYHVSENILAQLNFSSADIGRAQFENNLDRDFLKDNDREFQQFSLLGGYRVLPGRSYLGNRHKFNSAIYLLAGAGQIKFAGENSTTAIIGSSYRIVLTDSITTSLDIKDAIYERNFLADKKTTHNIEASISINVLF